jgi:flagellar protein FliS
MVGSNRLAGTYFEDQVKFASPVMLVIMLYDRAIECLRTCTENIRGDQTDLKAKGLALCRAVDIIAELQSVLDRQRGGEIAQNLDKLYAYMLEKLTVANYENNSASILEVITLLEELREGWRGAATQSSQTVTKASSSP